MGSGPLMLSLTMMMSAGLASAMSAPAIISGANQSLLQVPRAVVIGAMPRAGPSHVPTKASSCDALDDALQRCVAVTMRRQCGRRPIHELMRCETRPTKSPLPVSRRGLRVLR